MSNNGWGTYRTSLAVSMAAYDAAPPLLRYAMRNAVGKWAARPLIEAWQAGRREADLIAMMRREDAIYTRETYGPTHPEAARHD